MRVRFRAVRTIITRIIVHIVLGLGYEMGRVRVSLRVSARLRLRVRGQVLVPSSSTPSNAKPLLPPPPWVRERVIESKSGVGGLDED
jgi:hypothetical protein